MRDELALATNGNAARFETVWKDACAQSGLEREQILVSQLIFRLSLTTWSRLVASSPTSLQVNPALAP